MEIDERNDFILILFIRFIAWTYQQDSFLDQRKKLLQHIDNLSSFLFVINSEVSEHTLIYDLLFSTWDCLDFVKIRCRGLTLQYIINAFKYFILTHLLLLILREILKRVRCILWNFSLSFSVLVLYRRIIAQTMGDWLNNSFFDTVNEKFEWFSISCFLSIIVHECDQISCLFH